MQQIKDAIEQEKIMKRIQDDQEYFKKLQEDYKNNKNNLSSAEIKVMDRIYEANVKKINSLYFLEYAKLYGLSKENNESILAICNKKNNLSTELTDQGFESTVLTNNVDIFKLNPEEYILGNLGIEGIILDKEPFGLDMFSSLVPTNSNDLKKMPNIYDFDTIICEDDYQKIPIIMSYDTDNYIGFCDDISEETNKKIRYYEKTVDRLNLLYRQDFCLLHDTHTERGKEFCLIKRK